MPKYIARSPTGIRDFADLALYLENELRRIAEATIFADEIVLPKLHVAPERLQEGMIIFADGSDFDPGSGEGVYVRRSDAWHKLG